MLVGVFNNGQCIVNPPGTDTLTSENELLVVRHRPVGDPEPEATNGKGKNGKGKKKSKLQRLLEGNR